MTGRNKIIPKNYTGLLSNTQSVIIDTTIGIHESSVMPHYHDYIEICYIKKGEGKYLIDGRRYDFVEGDIFVINSSQIHVAYEDKDVEIQVLLFKPEYLLGCVNYSLEIECIKPYWEFGKRVDNKLSIESQYSNAIIQILSEIEQEKKQRDEGYLLMIRSLIIKLSTILIRYLNIKQDHDLPDRIKNYYHLQPLFDFIEQNYNQTIKLEEMAKMANMSIAGLSIAFKSIAGVSPIEYLIGRRIVNAAKILTESNIKIIEVAEKCGFNSISHFVECFKKYTGKTPRDYRKLGK